MSNPTTTISLEVLPQGIADRDAAYRAVDAAIAVIEKYRVQHGVTYFVGPSETSVEGDYETLMRLLKEAQEAAVAAGAKSVITIAKIFFNPAGAHINKGNYDFSAHPTYNKNCPL